MPSSPRYRQRFKPCRRLSTLIRPSHPVRQAWAWRNHRFFCNSRHSTLFVDRFGIGSPPRFLLSLDIEPELFAEKQILGCERRWRTESQPEESHNVPEDRKHIAGKLAKTRHRDSIAQTRQVLDGKQLSVRTEFLRTTGQNRMNGAWPR